MGGLFVNCCIQDLCRKEVINVNTGCRLGAVCDVEVDTCSGRIVSLIIYGKAKFMGLGAGEDIRVCWDDISVIGEDTILVCADTGGERAPREKRNLMDGLFR